MARLLIRGEILTRRGGAGLGILYTQLSGAKWQKLGKPVLLTGIKICSYD